MLPASAETLRVATYHVELSRQGPGLLLRDIRTGTDPQVKAVVRVIQQAAPDLLLLTDFDFDLDLQALGALRDQIAATGPTYEYLFALRPNTGVSTGLDMDGDGYSGDAADAQGFGFFSGDGGMALLSRYPIDMTGIRDFSSVLWKDLPNPQLPVTATGSPFPSQAALAVQRLSSTGHWVVRILAEHGLPLDLLVFYAGPPVFDGIEDRNGLRNHDEIVIWRHFLDGEFGPAPQNRYVLMGNANLDPIDGEGRKEAIRAVLADPRLQDPEPAGGGGVAASNPGHAGDPALDTADWTDPEPGNLRVDYILPSADWQVLDAGVVWPEPGQSGHDTVIRASRHRLVWVDLRQ